MSFTERPVRYLGYGAAFGEAIRYLFDNDIVTACYTVGGLFILAHCVVEMIDTSDIMKVLDTFIFEVIASAAIPTAGARLIIKLVNDILDRFRVSNEVREYAPTIVCLLCIVAVSDPLDSAVNSVMDMTVRKVLK